MKTVQYPEVQKLFSRQDYEHPECQYSFLHKSFSDKSFTFTPANTIKNFFSILLIPICRVHESGTGPFISTCTEEVFYAKHHLEYDSKDPFQIYLFSL